MTSIQSQSRPLTNESPSNGELHRKTANAVMTTRMLSDDEISDLAYIEACELDSPNSPDFDRLRNSIEERMLDEQRRVESEAPRA